MIFMMEKKGNTKMLMQTKLFLSNKLSGLQRLKMKFSRERIALFLMIFLMPTFAYAYGGSGGDEVTSIVQNLCSYLSGSVAKAIGILAIIFMGYRTLSGRMDWRLGGTIAIGLGLIIGGAYYGGMLLGNS